jgi:hypothetical protein
MEYKLVVSEATLFEFEETIDYYNLQKFNLGHGFALIINKS